MTLVQGGDRDTAQLVAVAILELRIKLNKIQDSELKVLCDAMLHEVEAARMPYPPRSQEGRSQEGRSQEGRSREGRPREEDRRKAPARVPPFR